MKALRTFQGELDRDLRPKVAQLANRAALVRQTKGQANRARFEQHSRGGGKW